jgi:hypothetical protein
LIPLVKALQPESFEEQITIEMLQSLELILQSSTTLDAFEKFLKQNSQVYKNGDLYLQLWLQCEFYRHTRSESLQEEIEKNALKLSLGSTHVISVQNEVFHALSSKFFKFFKQSEEYQEILREINRQQIYMHRIMQTSIAGEGLDARLAHF